MKDSSGDKTPQTVNERVAKLRAARKEAGLIKIEFWVTPENADKIKKYAAKLKT